MDSSNGKVDRGMLAIPAAMLVAWAAVGLLVWIVGHAY